MQDSKRSMIMSMSAQLHPVGSGRDLDGPFDAAALLAAPLRTDPYPHLIARNCLKAEALPALRRDFPRLKRPGYHPLDTFTPVGAFAGLIAQIKDGALEQAIGDRLGLDLASYPRTHTDSERKLATLLIYMNSGWVSPEGRIRVLRSESLDDLVEEISPEEGNVFAFRRTDASWHGHTPFRGERRVVQVTWLRDAEAADRKRRTGIFNWRLKGLFGR
jgi:SM-20-related protein